MLSCWLESELLPDQPALGGAHEIYKLLGKARIGGLNGERGKYVNGWIEPEGDGKLKE